MMAKFRDPHQEIGAFEMGIHGAAEEGANPKVC